MMIVTPILTHQHISEFNANGCCALYNAFSSSDIEIIDKWAKEVEELPEEAGKHWGFHESGQIDNKKLINRIEYISPFHNGFATLTNVLKIMVEQLLGEAAYLFKEKINFKMPGGSGFKPHQDSQAGWENYATNFVNVMLCIDEANEENGCLEIAPQQNTRGLLRGMEPLDKDDLIGMDFVFYPTKPGDLILFDAYTPHRSGPNLTKCMRRLYFATYNRATEGNHYQGYHEEKRKNFPPDIERKKHKNYTYKV